MLFGVDVSHHQKPSMLPWDRLRETAKFLIARTSYGTGTVDKAFTEHISRARDRGLSVGAYHFFRPSQPWERQFEVMSRQLELVDYGPGCLLPVLDVEDDPIPSNQPITPAWSDPCEQFVRALEDEYGGAMVYVTQRGWSMMGKPAWMLTRPLWVAHYTAAAKPATPGNVPWTLWQHRVGPYDPTGPGGYVKEHPDLDQNRCAGALPLIQRAAPPQPSEDAKLEILLAQAEELRIRVDGFEPGTPGWRDTDPPDEEAPTVREGTAKPDA